MKSMYYLQKLFLRLCILFQIHMQTYHSLLLTYSVFYYSTVYDFVKDKLENLKKNTIQSSFLYLCWLYLQQIAVSKANRKFNFTS
jgi:hypothetical protein